MRGFRQIKRHAATLTHYCAHANLDDKQSLKP
jgi:hypothetical protein